MKERPIILRPHEVRGILEQRQSQLRRVVKPQPAPDCPYGKPGDRLWVRESFQPLLADGVQWGDSDYETGEGYAINYVAAGGVKEFYDCRNDEAFCDRVTPSIHMPRWASRLTLEISDVRVQRLQEISLEDVLAEGITNPLAEAMWGPRWFVEAPESAALDTRNMFFNLWESIHGKGSRDANPWAWAVTFKVVKP